MPDFTRPEYASYIAFMREHPQERAWREGDWIGSSQGWTAPMVWTSERELVRPADRYIWLPQLADWLEMLELWQIDTVAFKTNPAWPAEHKWSCEGELGEWWEGTGPTREEAAARLFMAVTSK